MTEISKKKSLEKQQQIDRMMDDGLGAGRIVEEEDIQKLASEREKEELKESGQVPDPIQDQKSNNKNK